MLAIGREDGRILVPVPNRIFRIVQCFSTVSLISNYLSPRVSETRQSYLLIVFCAAA